MESTGVYIRQKCVELLDLSKPSINKDDHKHFESRGEVRAFGTVASYDPVDKDPHLSSVKTYVCMNLSTENQEMVRDAGYETMEQLVQAQEEVLSNVLDAAQKVLEQPYRKKKVSGREQMKLATAVCQALHKMALEKNVKLESYFKQIGQMFPAGFFNRDAYTKLSHTEADSAYTLIVSVLQENYNYCNCRSPAAFVFKGIKCKNGSTDVTIRMPVGMCIMFNGFFLAPSGFETREQVAILHQCKFLWQQPVVQQCKENH